MVSGEIGAQPRPHRKREVTADIRRGYHGETPRLTVVSRWRVDRGGQYALQHLARHRAIRLVPAYGSPTQNYTLNAIVDHAGFKPRDRISQEINMVWGQIDANGQRAHRPDFVVIGVANLNKTLHE